MTAEKYNFKPIVYVDGNRFDSLEDAVEPQKDYYSRSCPPLKSDFESKEAAEKWLNDYLKEDDLFKKAADEIKYLERRLDKIVINLHNHQHISMMDIHDCFESFNASLNHGSIKEVTKE